MVYTPPFTMADAIEQLGPLPSTLNPVAASTAPAASALPSAGGLLGRMFPNGFMGSNAINPTTGLAANNGFRGSLGAGLGGAVAPEAVVGGVGKFMRGAAPMALGSIGLNMFGDAIGKGATDTSGGGVDRADVGQFISGAGTGLGIAGPLAIALGASGPAGWAIGAGGAIGYGLYKAIWGSDKGPDKLKQTQTAVDKALMSLQSHDPQLAATLREQLDAQMALPLSKDEKLQTLTSAAQVIIQNTGMASQRQNATLASEDQLKAISAALGPMQARAQAQYDATLAPTNAEILRLAGQLGNKSTYAKYAAQTQIAAQRAQLQQQQSQYAAYPMMLALQQQQQLAQQYAPISLYGSPMAAQSASASTPQTATSPQLTAALAQYAK